MHQVTFLSFNWYCYLISDTRNSLLYLPKAQGYHPPGYRKGLDRRAVVKNLSPQMANVHRVAMSSCLPV